MKNVFQKTIFLFIGVFIVSCGTLQYNVGADYITSVVENYNNNIPENIPKQDGKVTDMTIFWDYVIDNNLSLNAYLNDKRKLKVNSMHDFKALIPHNKYLYNKEDIAISEAFSEEISGANYKNYFNQIIFEPMGRENAFAVPNGDIYISTEIVNLLKECDAGLRGIIAHEIAHLALRHSEVNYYANRKIEKKNKNKSTFLGILAASASAGLMFGALESGAQIEDPTPFSNLAVSSVNAIDMAYSINTERKKYLYSREQEIEADIVACMFLIWSGEDPADYIKALERMPDSYFITEYDSHPSNKFRIETLKGLMEEKK